MTFLGAQSVRAGSQRPSAASVAPRSGRQRWRLPGTPGRTERGRTTSGAQNGIDGINTTLVFINSLGDTGGSTISPCSSSSSTSRINSSLHATAASGARSFDSGCRDICARFMAFTPASASVLNICGNHWTQGTGCSWHQITVAPVIRW